MKGHAYGRWKKAACCLQEVQVVMVLDEGSSVDLVEGRQAADLGLHGMLDSVLIVG